MKFKATLIWNRFARLAVLGGFLLCLFGSEAQPALLSSVPANGAAGVPTNTTIVFTFSTAMNTAASSAIFYYGASTFVLVTFSWSAGDTVLTCSPILAFPPNTNIAWAVAALSTGGQLITPPPAGTFTTGSNGGGNGGGPNGTNTITVFEVGMGQIYSQTSSSPAVIEGDAPYDFLATTVLASNRFATNVFLILPTSVVTNLSQLFLAPWDFTLTAFGADLAILNAAYPPGNYSFNVQEPSSNQTVTVDFPSTLVQPAPPRISNFPATQAVDPTLAFTLTWDPFAGGTASDAITISMSTLQSVVVLPTNVLPGAATSILIPANTLQPNTNYSVGLNFARVIFTTNGNSYVTEAFRVTSTDFVLATLGGAANSLAMTNPAYYGGVFSFTVLASPGQIVVVEYKTNLTAATWQPLLTTNSPANQFSVSTPGG